MAADAAGGRFARSPSALIWLAIVLGLALRLAFSLGYWTDQPLTRDEREYLSLARSLASGRGFEYDEAVADPFGRAPGYPLFLAAVGGGSRPAPSHVPVAVKIAQSIVGAFGIWIVGVVGTRLGGSRAGGAAALLAAIYPPLVWTAAFALTEAVAWPLTLAVVALFDRACSAREQRLPAFLIAGLLAGAAVLVRPASLFFLLLAGLWLVTRRRPAAAVVLAAGALTIVGPWTVRNVHHYGRLVLVASEGGVTFWTGNHPRAIGEGDLAANVALKLDRERLRAEHPGLTEEQLEPVYYREALAWIGSHPLDWLRLEARKTFYFVVPIGPSYRVHSARYYVATFVSYALVLPMAIVGFFLLGDARRRSPGLWLLAGSAMVVSLVFFPQDRFRVSMLDPVLIVCAGAMRVPERLSPSA